MFSAVSRRLGQYFLINRAAIQKIIAALDLQKNDTVIEIGPGEGALTLPLAEKCQNIQCKIIAIEKDHYLVDKLISLKVDRLEIVKGDALKELKLITDKLKTYKLMGNIPYYITGKLLRILSELENKPKLTVLTIQKEVAERIVAQPPKMNLLAAAVQFWAESKIVMNLKPKDFSPPPKVDSSIIRLIPRPITNNQSQITNYYKTIKIIFKQPRKTLLNNLAAGLKMPKEKILGILQKIGLTGAERPQNLSIRKIERLISLSEPSHR
jgi:16S rRNA (adenine1518-N6/adenine1519-N6)-dimethyltransferase